jgi:hypothetical protein
VPTAFTVECFDVNRRRIVEGGASVSVAVLHESSSQPLDGVDGAQVRDAQDGSYAVTYTVPNRGDYLVRVSVGGTQIGGQSSPTSGMCHGR